MSVRRKFTDSFKLGQTVSIIRTEHGWFDGALSGEIIRISDYTCIVKDENGVEQEILKPRDIC